MLVRGTLYSDAGARTLAGMQEEGCAARRDTCAEAPRCCSAGSQAAGGGGGGASDTVAVV